MTSQLSENNIRRHVKKTMDRRTKGLRWSRRDKIFVTIEDVSCIQDAKGSLTRARLHIRGPMVNISAFEQVTTVSKPGVKLNTIPEIHGNVHIDRRVIRDGEEILFVRCMFVLLQEEDNIAAYGLFLIPSGEQKGEYIRIGLFEVVGSQVEGNTKENLVTLLRNGLVDEDDEFEAANTSAEDGIPRYSVTII